MRGDPRGRTRSRLQRPADDRLIAVLAVVLRPSMMVSR
jgi:hypothetical protein